MPMRGFTFYEPQPRHTPVFEDPAFYDIIRNIELRDILVMGVGCTAVAVGVTHGIMRTHKLPSGPLNLWTAGFLGVVGGGVGCFGNSHYRLNGVNPNAKDHVKWKRIMEEREYKKHNPSQFKQFMIRTIGPKPPVDTDTLDKEYYTTSKEE